jgi:hypothetical protein
LLPILRSIFTERFICDLFASCRTKIAYDYEGRCDPYQLGFGRGWSESDSEFDEDESENELDEPMDETVARAVGTTTAEGEASGAMDQDGQVNAEAGPSDAAAGPEPPSVASATAGAAAPDGQDEIHQQTLTSQLAYALPPCRSFSWS